MTCVMMAYTDRTDWLEKRRHGIGASDIAAIIGISPWSTPLQIWVSKTMDETPEPEPSEDMKWGVRMETAILDEFEFRQPQSADLTRGPLLRNIERPWMMATPDGWHPAEPVSVVEAKKVDAWSWDEIPKHYQVQVQWQLAVTGAQQGFLVVLHRGRRLEIYPVIADPELQAELVEVGEWFWGLVESETPPPVTAEDNAFLATLYPTHEEKPVEIAPEIAAEIRAAKDTMTMAKSRLELAEAKLKEIMGTADTAVVGQEVVATWKTQKASRVDVSMLRAEDPDIAESYTDHHCAIDDCKVQGRHTHNRVLRVKEAKE